MPRTTPTRRPDAAEPVAAALLDLARLEAERHRQERQLRSLLDAAQAGVSSLALREVLQRVLTAVRDLFGAGGAAVWRLDEGGVLRRFGSVGLGERYVRAAAAAGPIDDLAELIVRSAAPLAVADVAAEPRLRRSKELAAEGARSFLAAPLLSRGRPSGALAVFRADAHGFTSGEVDLLSGLANVVAASIENALLHARTERALAEVSAQRELLRTIVETAQDGILALDAEGRIVLFSPGCERLTGLSASEAEGRLAEEVLSDRSTASACPSDCPVKPLFPARGEPHAYTELLLPPPNGAGHDGHQHDGARSSQRGREGVRWVGASLARVAGRRPGRVRAVMVLRDITAAKEMDELKSMLLSTISHELRTPLTSIRALSELLAEHDFEAVEGRQVAATINRESERLTRLVDNVLDAARIEAGRLPTTPRPLALRPILEEALGVLQGRPGPRFSLKVSARLPLVLADPDRLRQVLDNLLSNAAKYGPSNGEVLIAARRDHDRVLVSVTDRGPGIPIEHLPRLFERFHRVGGERAPGGTGLGLYITRSLVELMGGSIEVDSRPGRGTTFSFTLPLAGGAEPA